MLLALAMLAFATGCTSIATDPEPKPSSLRADSRCAPGSILDARHALCNGHSGRWW